MCKPPRYNLHAQRDVTLRQDFQGTHISSGLAPLLVSVLVQVTKDYSICNTYCADASPAAIITGHLLNAGSNWKPK